MHTIAARTGLATLAGFAALVWGPHFPASAADPPVYRSPSAVAVARGWPRPLRLDRTAGCVTVSTWRRQNGQGHRASGGAVRPGLVGRRPHALTWPCARPTPWRSSTRPRAGHGPHPGRRTARRPGPGREGQKALHVQSGRSHGVGRRSGRGPRGQAVPVVREPSCAAGHAGRDPAWW